MVTHLDPRDYTDPYLATYAFVPPAREGVCIVCHTGAPPGSPTCRSCKETMSQVSHQTELVVPITLYRIPSQMWTVLRGYKDGYSETERTAHGVRVAATIARFLDVHRACIESVIGEAITLVTTVPSSRGRVGVHPLERAVRRASSISDLYASVLSRGPGEILSLIHI